MPEEKPKILVPKKKLTGNKISNDALMMTISLKVEMGTKKLSKEIAASGKCE
jgi:hypothetical protein